MHTITLKKSGIRPVFTRAAISFLLVITLTSCVSTSNAAGGKDAPLWINAPDETYADSEYVSAVGYALDRPTAEANAIANLSKTIRLRVEADASSTQSFETGSSSVDMKLVETIQISSVLEEIAGIKIQEIWTDKDGTVYALALINRDEVGRYYSGKIRDYDAGITGFIDFAAESPASFDGIGALEKALAFAYENELHLDLLAIINPMLFATANLSYQSAQAIEVLTQQEKEKINIGISIEGDTDGRITSALAEVFKKAGLKTQILPKGTSTDGVPYVLTGDLSIEPFEMASSSDNRFARFVLNTELVDIRTDKILLPWGINGREAHLTAEEAAQRAIRTVEQEIEKEYLKEVQKITN